jgi:hypothetical protein
MRTNHPTASILRSIVYPQFIFKVLSIICVVSTLPSAASDVGFGFAAGMGGTGNDSSGNIGVDASGNVYSAGHFVGMADFDPGPGTTILTGFGTFVQKLDGDGNFLWAKGTVGAGADAIAVDASGNVYVTGGFSGTVDFDPGAGTTNLTPAGGQDIFVQKLDSDGIFLWAVAMGGSETDAGRDITVDASGNVYTTGKFEGTADFDPGAGTANLSAFGSSLSDVFVSKLDSSGVFVWAGGMGGSGSDEGLDIAVDASGNVHTTGRMGGTGDFDPGAGTVNLIGNIFVSKLNSSGSFLWAKAIDATSSGTGQNVALDNSGNVYTVGDFSATADFDPGAGMVNIDSVGLTDVFIQKLDSTGNFLWAKTFGGKGSDIAYGIALDGSNNVYTTGDFNLTVDFDPGVGTVNLTSNGLRDIFIQKLDSSGNFVWAKVMGGTTNDIGYGIAVDASSNVFTTGDFGNTVDFDPGAGTTNLTSVGSADIYVHKLIEEPIVTSIVTTGQDPTSHQFVRFEVKFSESVTGVDVTDFAIDATGVTGASIHAVTGTATKYTVTVNSGTGDGTLSIDLVDDDSIADTGGILLGGSGANNGDFTTGDSYTMDRSLPVIMPVGETLLLLLLFAACLLSSVRVVYRV